MKKKPTIYFSILITFLPTLFFSSCIKENKPDDVLTLSKTPYNGNQLRIDGYYYELYNSQINNFHFLCNNGVLIDFSGVEYSFEDIENYIKNPETLERVRNTKYGWGLFVIEDDNIKMEQWHPNSGYIPAYMRVGKILNDSTFHITEMYRFQNNEKTNASSISETYHFRKYSPKPDSTNKFIP